MLGTVADCTAFGGISEPPPACPCEASWGNGAGAPALSVAALSPSECRIVEAVSRPGEVAVVAEHPEAFNPLYRYVFVDNGTGFRPEDICEDTDTSAPPSEQNDTVLLGPGTGNTAHPFQVAECKALLEANGCEFD